MKKKPLIAITLGDPAGIGPEVVLKALARPALRRAADFIIIGSNDALGCALEYTNARPLSQKGITLFEPCRAAPVRPGRWSRKSGELSLAWVREGIRLCMSGDVDALVTGPICKAAWRAAGATAPGHTELLAEMTGAQKEVMMLAGGGLRVALVTVHEPLHRVADLVTRKRIVDVCTVLHKGLRDYFALNRPRIAVLGLNPHSGEEGRMGTEEEKVIIPAIKTLRRHRINVNGPVPADTAFHYAREGRYDAVLAMYHDQGLGPLKTVAFDTGVNITLGLPIIRTSVDHGTAFDIAGKGIAKSDSCAQAITTAVEMIHCYSK